MAITGADAAAVAVIIRRVIAEADEAVGRIDAEPTYWHSPAQRAFSARAEALRGRLRGLCDDLDGALARTMDHP